MAQSAPVLNFANRIPGDCSCCLFMSPEASGPDHKICKGGGLRPKGTASTTSASGFLEPSVFIESPLINRSGEFS